MDIFKEYPKTKIEDFKGDHNFAGDGFRCSDVPAWPFAGETRSVWWDRCRELIHGFHKVLIVGPRGSGRTKLVHAMATTNESGKPGPDLEVYTISNENIRVEKLIIGVLSLKESLPDSYLDAVLFELDPQHLSEFPPEQVQHAAAAVASCARAAQPAVIYLKHAQLLYYKRNKAPPGEELNTDISDLIRRYITKKIIKRIQKSDNVTIIATCSNPWLIKNTLLKQFPEVVLIPDTSYSVVMQLVHSWVTTNHSIPRDFDVQSLARILQGYSYSAIQVALQHFLGPEQVVKIAVNGLSAMEILNYVLQTEVEKNDYEKYEKWYSDNTLWGKKEKKQLEEAREFKAVAEKYAEKKKKKKTKAPSEVSTT